MLSKTPLTDFVFKKKAFPRNLNQPDFGIREEEESDEEESDEDVVIELKLMVRKSSGEILFGEAAADFADLLFSFLTFPLCCVLCMLEGFTSLGCIHNLYKSMTELNGNRYFRSQRHKDKLAFTGIAQPFQIRNQILPIWEAPLPVSDSHDDAFMFMNFFDPKSPKGESYCSGGFARKLYKYMVTDDLVVTPISSFDIVSYLQRMNVPLNDLEERVIFIGVNEVNQCVKVELSFCNFSS